MTLVLDASVAASALVGLGPYATWAEAMVAQHEMAAPELMQAETANVLRGYQLNGVVPPYVAASAHADLMRLPITLYGYRDFADRAWELRNTITVYDAWYVALAEALEVPLATLDLRLARAPGARCAFLTPPE